MSKKNTVESAVSYSAIVEAFLNADPARAGFRGIEESLIRAHRDFRPFAKAYRETPERATLRPHALAAVLLDDERFVPGGGVPGAEVGSLLLAAGFTGRDGESEVTSWPTHMRALAELTWEHDILGSMPAVESVTDPAAAAAKAAAAKAEGRKNSGRNPVMYRPIGEEGLEAVRAYVARATAE